jgi:putative DNA primase/helicase
MTGAAPRLPYPECVRHSPAWAPILPQRCWVAFRAIRRPTNDGTVKTDKVPVDPETGTNARWRDPAVWRTFDEAVAAMHHHAATGIAIVLSHELGLVVIDLDDAASLITGFIALWARTTMEMIGSYAEFSYSGRGLHVISRAVLPPAGRRGWFDGHKVEVYGDARVMAVTGLHVSETPLEICDRAAEVMRWHSQVDFAPVVDAAFAPLGDVSEMPDGEDLHTTAEDRQLLARAAAAADGGKFARLLAGQWEALYPSQSEADEALIIKLLFWCRGDAVWARRLFAHSALAQRAKWLRRPDYQTRTMAAAWRFYTQICGVPASAERRDQA